MDAPRDAGADCTGFPAARRASRMARLHVLVDAFQGNVNGMDAGTSNRAIRDPRGPGVEDMAIYPA